jgi:nucleoside-diphosphate-sugar epimerase
VPEPVASAARRTLDLLNRLPIPIPVLVPNVRMQFIHEQDVGQALLKCVLGEGPPGAYNIAAEGVLSGADVARELGLAPVPIPARAVHAAARLAASLPRPSFAPPGTDWVEAVSHPAIMDTTKAKRELGWRPQYSALEALRATLRPEPDSDQTAPDSPVT